MKVWIDADQCMGAGTCASIAPEVFVPRSDGIWAVRQLAEDFGETTVFDGGAGPGHGPEGAVRYGSGPRPPLRCGHRGCPGMPRGVHLPRGVKLSRGRLGTRTPPRETR